MAFYVLAMLLVALVASALSLHYGFAAFEALPASPERTGSVTDQDFFAVDYKLYLNIGFLVTSAGLAALWHTTDTDPGGGEMAEKGALEKILTWLALASYLWVAGGLVASFVAS
jgi:hypothetical protein